MRILLVWVGVCLIWSTVWLFIKLGLEDLPPVSFAGLRLLLAVLVLTPVVVARRIALPRRGRDLALVAVTGFLLLGLNYALLYWGAQFIPSGLTAVLQSTQPAFGLLFAHRLLREERITPAKLAALALGVGGVAVISSEQLSVAGWEALWGCVAVTTAAVFVGLAYVLVKARGAHLNPTALMLGQMVCGMLPLLTYGLAVEGNPLAFNWTTKAVVSLVYLVLAGSVAAFWLNYWLLKRMDATKVLLMAIVEPLLAVLLGALVLGETLTGRTFVGGAFILLSVALVLTRRGASRATLEAAAADEG
ncbi:MAG TPA: DMT family transporter [Pyrinomonadaceae bacterium]|nr:DMT family transporter [Pyrinomonadaceae bacterium]